MAGHSKKTRISPEKFEIAEHKAAANSQQDRAERSDLKQIAKLIFKKSVDELGVDKDYRITLYRVVHKN